MGCWSCSRATRPHSTAPSPPSSATGPPPPPRPLFRAARRRDNHNQPTTKHFAFPGFLRVHSPSSVFQSPPNPERHMTPTGPPQCQGGRWQASQIRQRDPGLSHYRHATRTRPVLCTHPGGIRCAGTSRRSSASTFWPSVTSRRSRRRRRWDARTHTHTPTHTRPRAAQDGGAEEREGEEDEGDKEEDEDELVRLLCDAL